MLCPIELHPSIDGDGRCVWHVNVLVKLISLFAEVGYIYWKFIAHGVIDSDSSAVIEAFYQVCEAWVMREIFDFLNAYGSQVDFGSRGGFTCSEPALCDSGSNLGCRVDVLEVILQ